MMNKQDVLQTKSRGRKDQDFAPVSSGRGHKKYDEAKKQKRVDEGFRAWQRSVDTSLESIKV